MREQFDTFGVSSGSRGDGWDAVRPEPVDETGSLDPRAAAALLDETTREAERRFSQRPPWLTVTAAVVVLIAYGAVWFSVRHQHPYSGPTGTALAELYGTLAVWIVVVTIALGRSLRGRSSRQRTLEGVTFAAIWICVYIFQGALHHANPTHAIAYGVYPAVAPLIVVGAAAAGYEAARDHAGRAAFAVAAVALGAFASFAGPADVWGVVGVGLSALLLLAAAAQLRWGRS